VRKFGSFEWHFEWHIEESELPDIMKAVSGLSTASRENQFRPIRQERNTTG
jgi:hypothetical protein